jgi:hypothetical protein
VFREVGYYLAHPYRGYRVYTGIAYDWGENERMLSQLTEVLSAIQSIAVVISLTSIFIQLRQTNRLAQTNSYQNLFQSHNDWLTAIIQDGYLGTLFFKGRETPQDLTQEEKIRFFLLCTQWFSFHENAFIQHHKGVLPEELYRGWQRALVRHLQQPGFADYWTEEKEEYAPSFVAYVDGLRKGQ